MENLIYSKTNIFIIVFVTANKYQNYLWIIIQEVNIYSVCSQKYLLQKLPELKGMGGGETNK